ncbi:hypothetical protein EV193_10434 [Herbihabitans rhizosphaerae]|uniref:Uncharacterized protein n=1 Tax=Herbihabitans rhizosphaerae TaxID=1872711 RepID=A0A4Q7KQL8_9PSEU|nr:hypothetical protein [Herbihabitans rhizosphaerae]RZS38825.1 hypothetical protein EV193_10434 [Herbihabitans rhizosphaerae]
MPSYQSDQPGQAPRARWVGPLLVVVIALAAAVGVIGREIYRQQPAKTAAAPVLPSTSFMPDSALPGSPAVQATADAADHPMFETARKLLQSYFDAINSRQYDLWRSVVTRERAASQPEPKWRSDFKSTTDGSIIMYRIHGGQGDARILLGFISKQNPADAPLELPERCIRWRVVFALTVENNAWKIDAGSAGASPQHEKC